MTLVPSPRIGAGGNIRPSPTDLGERGNKSSPLDETMTPRKKNRAHERLMAFLNRNNWFVSAVAVVDKHGNQIDHRELLEKLDLIHYELEKLNTTLEEVIK